jgi:PIN domain nuclease of toxin-antitoxin system
MIVVDSSALMAFVLKEPGADRVEAALGECIVSAVVLVECLSKLAAKGLDPNAIKAQLMTAGLQIEPFGDEGISAVVSLHRFAKQGVSLADRFCLGLALQRGLSVLTGDRPWAGLGLPLQIELIR